ncbi:MAG: fatty acyl-AMP ligase, partial [Bacteroidetes bacterium]|nr:fatty acyl-AMP ligase [Bacteroidota bacterium]
MALENFLNNRITEEDTFQYSITDILKYRAEQTPEQTAYIFLKDGEDDEEKLTYAELYGSAMHIAGELIKAGARGERALMLYPPGLEFVTALFGCLYSGVVAVPAYPPRKNRSLNRIRSIVADSGAAIVMTTEQIHQTFLKNFQDVEELKNLQWVETLVEKKANSDTEKYFVPETDDVALLQYTSGSTGQPKGVIVSHQNIMRNSEFLRQCFELSTSTVSVNWLPSFHDMGLILGVIQPIFTGFTVVLIPPVAFVQKPSRWMKAITKYKGTHAGGPNFSYDLCVEKTTDEEKDRINLVSLNTFYNGAESVRQNTLLSFTDAFSKNGFELRKFYPTYGMAETTLIISGGKINDDPVFLELNSTELEKGRVVPADENTKKTSHHVGVGYAWIDTKIIVADPETLKVCPDDIVGEIWVSGSIVTKGYWKKPDETENIFNAYTSDTREGPFLRTGDLGFRHNGELFIAGRIKDMIIIRGRNYYPQDIELITESASQAIRPNCSAAFSIEKDGEEKLVVVAEVERTFIRDLDIDALCDEIRAAVFEEFELDIYGIQLLRTASIPKTSSGKIQRRICREGFLQGTLEVIGESILDDKPLGNSDHDQEISLVSVQSW